MARDVKSEHSAVVHLVNVVAGEHQHVLRRVPVQERQVLEDGVGGAAVPGFGHLLLRRQQFDELLEAAVEETPAVLDVANQAVRLVLRRHPDAANAGIHAVGKREIDDAELAAKWHRRFAAPVGELFQPSAAPSGEHQRDRRVREFADKTNRLGLDASRAVIFVPTVLIERHVLSQDGLQAQPRRTFAGNSRAFEKTRSKVFVPNPTAGTCMSPLAATRTPMRAAIFTRIFSSRTATTREAKGFPSSRRMSGELSRTRTNEMFTTGQRVGSTRSESRVRLVKRQASRLSA